MSMKVSAVLTHVSAVSLCSYLFAHHEETYQRTFRLEVYLGSQWLNNYQHTTEGTPDKQGRPVSSLFEGKGAPPRVVEEGYTEHQW